MWVFNFFADKFWKSFKRIQNSGVDTFIPLARYKVIGYSQAYAFESETLKNEMTFRTLIKTLIKGSEKEKQSFQTFLENYEPFQMLYPKWIELSKKTIELKK